MLDAQVVQMKKNENETYDDVSILIRSLPVPVLVVNKNRIRAANEAAGRYLGTTPAALSGKSPLDIISDDDRTVFEESCRRAHEDTANQVPFNARFIREDGGTVMLSVSIGSLTPGGEGGSCVIILAPPPCIHEETSELQESEERFRKLAESTPMAILLYQDDRWVFINTAAERITGYSSTEMSKMNFWDIVHPDFKELVEGRGKRRQAGQEEISSYEFMIITKSGKARWVMLNGTTTHFGGKPAGLINVIDITDIKGMQDELALRNIQLNQKNVELQIMMDELKATNEELEATNEELHVINEELITSQKDLEESEYRYRDIFNNFPVGIYQIRLEGDFITANDEMARILGYETAGAVTIAGENVKNFYADPDAREHLLDEVRRKGHMKGYETKFRRKNGELIWVSMNTRMRRSADGTEEYLEGYMQDITAQKQAEEENARLEKQLIQSQKMEAIGRLAGGIAHDFNNLLTAIMGNAEIAAKAAGEGSGIGDNINDILVTSRRAAELTRQLLAFSRKQVIKHVIIDINTFLARVERMLRRIIGENIKLNIHREHDLANVKADYSQIEQLIVNLVVNARDAMPNGGTITIVPSNQVITDALSVKDETILPGLYVRIDVSDTGVGMDNEIMEKIFEPFFSTKEEMGTGLGLATVYGIVRQNEGYIAVESEKGKGSTFSVFLPRNTDASRKDDMEPVDITVQGPVTCGETILIVEDEDSVRKLLVRNLSDEGYRVLEASNSRNALAICSRRQQPIDLILSDVILPDLDGPKLIEKVRLIRPGIRVLYMSGYTEHKTIDIEVLKENVYFIPKPFLPSELKKKIREVLTA